MKAMEVSVEEEEVALNTVMALFRRNEFGCFFLMLSKMRRVVCGLLPTCKSNIQDWALIGIRRGLQIWEGNTFSSSEKEIQPFPVDAVILHSKLMITMLINVLFFNARPFIMI